MIRPIDLQNTMLQAMQSAPAVQRADEAPRLAAQAVQAEFAAAGTQRDESVAASAEVLGNRIGAKPENERKRHPDPEKARRHFALEDVADDAGVATDEPDHLIDFSA